MDLTSKLSNIKNHLLDLAIRGKLVEQRPEEGTAEELYTQIQEEKKKLIAEGKIKKEKPLPEIKDEEIPFEIPESWKWVRITEIALNIFAGGDKPNNLTSNITENNKVPVVANGLVNEGIIGYTDSYSVEKGCITVSGRGTIGFPVIRTYNFFPIVRLIVINPSKLLFDKYLYYYLSSQKYDSTGTSIPQLTVPMIKPKIIPLPPLAEQKRIVEKLESYLAVIDKAEALIDKKANLDEEIRNKIFDLAIKGKLVEQRPEEGTAEELYAQIQEEKKKLIAEGNIKKDKPLPEIKDEEIPFEIPTNWKWARFGKLLINRDSERIPLSVEERKVLKKIYDYYGASGVIDKVENYLFEKKLLLIGEDGANLLSRSKPIAFIAEGKYWVNNHAHVIDYFVNYISIEFVMYFINSISLAPFVTGTAQPKMTQDKLNSIPVPLPPLAEQKRIVAKIEELLPYCDKLK